MWFKKKEITRDAFEMLDDRIDALYAANPFVRKLSIGIYQAELDCIVRSMSIYLAEYTNFKALLNGDTFKYYFRGVELYKAPSKNEVHKLIGRRLYVDITNQEEFKKKEGEK